MKSQSVSSWSLIKRKDSVRLHSLEVKPNICVEVDDLTLKQIYGGRLPDSNEVAVIIADANSAGSRALTGAILNDVDVKFNIAVADPGSSNNTVNQING